MALLQSFLEKNESISEIICLSLTIAFSIESFLIALKDTHFLRNTELKAILFYLRNLNNLFVASFDCDFGTLYMKKLCIKNKMVYFCALKL